MDSPALLPAEMLNICAESTCNFRKVVVCGAKTPSLTRGVPVLPARVPCGVCGARQVYRPSEVFIGSLSQVWKGQALR